MKDKKHIDELFKDRFNNFEVSPSPEVWRSIQTSLDKRKKDRKIIPLWWKLGGVAALLALLFTIGNTVFNTSATDANIVTSEESSQPVDANNDRDPLLIDNDQYKDAVTAEENTSKIIPVDTEKASEGKDHINTSTKKSIYKEPALSKNSVAVESKIEEHPEGKIETTLTKRSRLIKDPNEVIEAKKDIAVLSEKQDASETRIKKSETIEKGQEMIGVKEKDGIKIAKTEVITARIDPVIKEKKLVDTEVAKTETDKQSILDAIKEQEAIKAEEAVVSNKKNILDQRWDVAPNFAPVYYNTLSSGSSLDPSFSDNSQSGDVNFSYGVQVSYALSERLSLRSGVSNVDLSYSTSGIELGTGPVSTALQSVNYEGKQIVLTALDQGTIEAQNTSNGGFGNIIPKATDGEAKIIQSISYYEIPLELKYALLNKKIGVNLIGGLSTLFLGNNDVTVEAGSFQSTLGEANNLTSVSFSTNVGLGFDYKLSKKFKFNIEPLFKYQLNPYTDSSINFKPYYLGVYTGLSYKF
jgi:hypothetical protein